MRLENSIQNEKIQNEPKKREQYADDFLQFLDKAEDFDFLHGQKFKEIFSDEEHKRKFIDNLNYL